jgi:hypothetical protein
MENKTIQLIVASAVIVFLGLLTDPFMLWMPPIAGMALLLCATVLLCVWGGFVMKEKAHDEREVVHRMYAGRTAYLLGIAVLTVALVVQGLAHHIDPWIALALGVMVIAKLGSHFYSDKYQ